MPTFPLADWQRIENAGAVVSGSSAGTSIAAPGSSNTKAASYTQLIASTAFPASAIMVMIDTPLAGARDYLIDIAVGAAASEQIILADLLCSPASDSIMLGTTFLFMINIPAGSRISARCQCSINSATIRVSCLLFGAGFATGETLSRIETCGANTSDSGGVSVDPGGSANNKGSYSQLTASTSFQYKYIALAIGNQRNTTMATGSWLLDIAVGAAASEQVIAPNLTLHCHLATDGISPQVYPLIPVTIPAGSRLAVRAQSTITDATDRLLDVVLYGMG